MTEQVQLLATRDRIVVPFARNGAGAGVPADILPLNPPAAGMFFHFHPIPPEIIYRTAKRRESSGASSIPRKIPDPYPAIAAEFETIGTISTLGTVAEGCGWQNFERLAAFIFEKNGYVVSVNTVKTKHRERRQYDVIAQRNGRTILAECKQWSGGRCRLSALKAAVGRHRERARFYENVTDTESVPVIVTLIEEEIRIFDGVPLVPVHKLNAFICELDACPDGWSFAEFEDKEEDNGQDPACMY